MFKTITLKQQKFSQFDPVLIRPELASVLIQSDPVLIRAHLWYIVPRGCSVGRQRYLTVCAISRQDELFFYFASHNVQ